MWIILILFPFSISLLTICTIPPLEYVLPTRPLRFNSRQWNAILLFVGVKFLFMNIRWDFSRPIDVLSMFFKLFLLTRAFFCVFSINKSYDCRFWGVFWFSLIHLHQSYLKSQLLSPQSSDYQHHLESQWFQGFSFDHIASRNCCFLPVRLLFFKVVYFIAQSLVFNL